MHLAVYAHVYFYVQLCSYTCLFCKFSIYATSAFFSQLSLIYDAVILFFSSNWTLLGNMVMLVVCDGRTQYQISDSMQWSFGICFFTCRAWLQVCCGFFSNSVPLPWFVIYLISFLCFLLVYLVNDSEKPWVLLPRRSKRCHRLTSYRLKDLEKLPSLGTVWSWLISRFFLIYLQS